MGSRINLNWCNWLVANGKSEDDGSQDSRKKSSVKGTINYNAKDNAFEKDNLIHENSCPEYNDENLACHKFSDEERVWTLTEISGYNGLSTNANPSGTIFLSVGGVVFDVSKGREFYGVGQHYNCFAAKAVSRALALGSLEKQDIELGDQVEDFTENQIQNIRNQVDFYSTK